jgi:hypothetical protein
MDIIQDAGVKQWVCVPSIMHSGTRFVCEEVLKGYRHHPFLHPQRPKGYFRQHTTELPMTDIEPWMNKYPSIVPMRHPARIAKSFMDREHVGQIDYLKQWRTMIALSQRYQLTYFHVDLPDISPYLMRAEILLGHAVSPDRSRVIGEHGNAACDLEIGSAWVTDWIMDFYYSTL